MDPVGKDTGMHVAASVFLGKCVHPAPERQEFSRLAPPVHLCAQTGLRLPGNLRNRGQIEPPVPSEPSQQLIETHAG
jgi:hypothetical protein